MQPKSVLEAIKMGIWDFEPPETSGIDYDAVDAMPGTQEKLDEMARRVSQGLPLWHEEDREDMDDPPPTPRNPR